MIRLLRLLLSISLVSHSHIDSPNMSKQQQKNAAPPSEVERKILVLHGSRQVGQLLVGRMDKLRKKLQKGYSMGIVAPDAPFPHPDDGEMRQWWNRSGDEYVGIDQTLDLIQSTWNDNPDLEGILGFSMGSRLAQLLVQCHESKNHSLNLKGLQLVIMCAGYDAPMPSNLDLSEVLGKSPALQTPSLHVYGLTDKLITPSQSQAVMPYYKNPVAHEHDGGHHVPMRAANVEVYLNFIGQYVPKTETLPLTTAKSSKKVTTQAKKLPVLILPNEEAMMSQQDEAEALSAIFPEEFKLVSKMKDDETYTFPISYQIDVPPSEEGVWPPHPLSLRVSYPHNYPADVMADIQFVHNNNMMEFSSGQMQGCLQAMRNAAEVELGMPSVLTCVYAVRDFFESGRMEQVSSAIEEEDEQIDDDNTESNQRQNGAMLKSSSAERIKECNLQGLEIARKLLLQPKLPVESMAPAGVTTNSHGGTWKYTCGLVGKPSAGKSTFFNAASAFARQRNDAGNAIGGATMAPHPFTTIDPNIGFCLIPAPEGSCPEEAMDTDSSIGCTHGRDHLGRRLIPVMLKDVAGLVPGAYQGRGRGNKFLNDLTDADVLIHVVDASGTADTEGNAVGSNEDGVGSGSHPLQDLAWILNELIEWVFNNVTFKWESIRRKGRNKLSDMFSGYGQSQAVLHSVFVAVEKYMEETLQRDRALELLDEWDEGDLHRLVSAFLGVRFPMALALNKKDLPSAKVFIRDVQEALPIHGAHVGIPLSARSEMTFVKEHILRQKERSNSSLPPEGVWQCLQSAISLREPVLVFPVNDMTTYFPLPGMTRVATEDASLPSAGMVSCLVDAGGAAPTLWSGSNYVAHKGSPENAKLRDALVMKPGSTVEDVFLSLKRMGALGGEFVRAEGAGDIGEKAKLVPKHEVVNKSNRILKIMTNKRREWQT